MSGLDDSLGGLLDRIREGDAEAAVRLVREYEDEVRRVVRLRLRDQRLRAVHDSMDVVQSVFASFFVRLSLGTCRVETPDDVVRLLVRMTCNKVVDVARHGYAGQRDVRRTQAIGERVSRIPQHTNGSPEETVELADLVDAFRAQLTDEERAIAEMRRDGADWASIAARFGGTPDAQRIRFARTIREVSDRLGLDVS